MELNLQAKLITCVFAKGKGHMVLHALFEKGVTRAEVSFARGSDLLAPVDKKGLLQIQEEKEIVTVVCENKTKADEIFNFIFEIAEVNQQGGGLMYMTSLSGASAYLLPDIDLANNQQQASPEV